MQKFRLRIMSTLGSVVVLASMGAAAGGSAGVAQARVTRAAPAAVADPGRREPPDWPSAFPICEA